MDATAFEREQARTFRGERGGRTDLRAFVPAPLPPDPPVDAGRF
jgi:hypothetical protein